MRTHLLAYIDELLALYPARGLYGHKGHLACRIFRHVPSDARTFVDLFGGSGIISWGAKLLELEVLSSEIMGFGSLRLRALVANDGCVLTESDIDLLASPNPDKQDWCERWYGLAIGTDNARFLDLLASNLHRLDCDLKRDVAIYIAVLVVMSKMNYCAVTFSVLKTLTGKRKLHGLDLQSEFRWYALQQFPFLVFSNGKRNRATRRDALDLVGEVQADVLYVDSPYCSPGGKYASDHAFYDKLVLILQGHADKVRNPYNGAATLPPHVDFSKRKSALMGFARLFMRAKGCRRIIVSYNTTSEISPFEIASLAQRHYGTLASWEEVATIRPTTSDKGLKKTGEVILVFDRYENRPAGKPLAFVVGPTIELPDQFRFIDLFAGGMGAMHIAGKRAGARCVFSSEIIRAACRNYVANHRMLPAGDITKINPMDIPEHEILCGGFPCQAFSLAGHQRGFIDKRGLLFLEIVRIARAKRVPVLFLENVDALANRKNRKILKAICDEIEAAGYDVHYKVLNSSFFGCATARRRIYFACFRKDLGVTRFEFPEPTCELTSLRDCLLPDSETTKYVVDADELDTLRWVKPKPMPCPLGKGDRCPHGKGDNCPLRTVRIGVIRDGSQGDRLYDGAFHAPTIVTGFGSDIHLIDGRMRRLAPREMANCMGFPRDFILPENDDLAKKFIGNSMAVPVIEKIFARIVETLRAKAAVASRRAA